MHGSGRVCSSLQANGGKGVHRVGGRAHTGPGPCRARTACPPCPGAPWRCRTSCTALAARIPAACTGPACTSWAAAARPAHVALLIKSCARVCGPCTQLDPTRYKGGTLRLEPDHESTMKFWALSERTEVSASTHELQSLGRQKRLAVRRGGQQHLRGVWRVEGVHAHAARHAHGHRPVPLCTRPD